MNRRELFKKAIPIAALAPVAMAEGVLRYDLEPAGHFLFFIDSAKIDMHQLIESGSEDAPLMPKGSKGGWIIPVHGPPEEAIKIFRLDDAQAEEIMGRPPDIKT